MTAPSSIAHYRIVSKLGEGGMGAVYRATDTKLNREVAIKILPPALAEDPDYVARFTREAQVLASLNHPNIAIIHGVEENALVMELVPGSTVADRIAAGPIPIEEALEIAAQIAEALEAAHEKGVIHRDLKPANVKVTPEGVVKVLDFGLAKTADAVSSVTGANSPTLSMRATQAGVIMGTAGYMAPEQAAGKPVDRRADIWSFGVVLYELLTGKMLFTGETLSHTLASVLKDPIDCDLPQAPPPIRRLLARCLNRNPKERLRDIGEARIAIRSHLANPAGEESKPPQPVIANVPVRGLRLWLPRAIHTAAYLALAAVLVWIFKPAPDPPVTRFSLALGLGQGLNSIGRLSLAISSDGTQVAYTANGQLFLHAMSEMDARPIGGAGAGARGAVFSPDGKSLTFFAGGNLMRTATSGGAAVTLCECGGATTTGLSWSEGGILVTNFGKGILRVPPNGGPPETLLRDKDAEVMADAQLLPGGDTVLFSFAASVDSSLGLSSRWNIAVQNLKSGVRKILVADAVGGRYLPTGHLVYWTKGVLYAAPFNLKRLELAGSPASIVEGVVGGTGVAQYAYSATGTLVYLPGPLLASGETVLARVDRKGEIEALNVPPASYGFPRASKDGRYVAYQLEDSAESGIWVWELSGASAPRRLTLPGAAANRYPVWTPDGTRIAFQSNRAGDMGIWWQPADGSGAAEHLTTPGKGVVHFPDSWSPDGQTLSFTEQKDRGSEVWTYSLREKKATVLATGPGSVFGRSAFSPDGRWVAYQSAGADGDRIYVRTFPSGAEYVAPQDADPHHPAWSPDGKELFYCAGPGMAGSMSISTHPNVSFGSPVRAPRAGFRTGAPQSVRTFDVLPDGQHFIGVVPAGTLPSQSTQQIQVVLNWFTDLKQRAPGK